MFRAQSHPHGAFNRQDETSFNDVISDKDIQKFPSVISLIDLNERETVTLDRELQQELDRHARRQQRRKRRSEGFPPDPDDSEDSLVNEIMETGDDRIFGIQSRAHPNGVAWYDQSPTQRPRILQQNKHSLKVSSLEHQILKTSKGFFDAEKINRPDLDLMKSHITAAKECMSYALRECVSLLDSLKTEFQKQELNDYVDDEAKLRSLPPIPLNYITALNKSLCEEYEKHRHIGLEAAESIGKFQQAMALQLNLKLTSLKPCIALTSQKRICASRSSKHNMVKRSNILKPQQVVNEPKTTSVAYIPNPKKTVNIENNDIPPINRHDPGPSEPITLQTTRFRIMRRQQEDIKKAHIAKLQEERRKMAILKKVIAEEEFWSSNSKNSIINAISLPRNTVSILPTASKKDIKGINEVIAATDVLNGTASESVTTSVLSKKVSGGRRPYPPPTKPYQMRPEIQLPYPSATTTTAFTSSPSKIVFKDYTCGKVHQATAIITNTSCRANSFKILPIPVELASFFEIHASPPGKMSAGMVAQVAFLFKPPAGFTEDVEGAITFEAEFGGFFTLSLSCSSPKCVPVISENKSIPQESHADNAKGQSLVVDFGVCIPGSKVHRTLILRNDGALESIYHIERTNEDLRGKQYDTYMSSSFKVLKNDNSVLGKYGHENITIVFEPEHLAEHESFEQKDWIRQASSAFSVKFDNCSQIIYIQCVSRMADCPVSIERDQIDLGVCAVGSLYKESINLMNCSNIALKFWIEFAQDSGNYKMNELQSLPYSSTKEAELDNSMNYSCVATDGIDSEFEEMPDLDTVPAPMMPPGGSQQIEILPTMSRKAESSPTIKQLPSRRSDSLSYLISDVGEVEILPKFAFAQPSEQFTVWVKVKPTRAAYILLANGANKFIIPLKIKYITQGVHCCIPVSIAGQITTTDLLFSVNRLPCSDILFGECQINQRKDVNLEIQNLSSIPQKVLLLSSNLAISCTAHEDDERTGLIILPPLSSVVRKISFEPKQPGAHSASLLCHSNWGRKFELKCKGSCKAVPADIFPNSIIFGKTGLGSTHSVGIHLKSFQTTPKGHTDILVESKVRLAWVNPATAMPASSDHLAIDHCRHTMRTQFKFLGPLITSSVTKNEAQSWLSNRFQQSATRMCVLRDLSVLADQALQRVNPDSHKAFMSTSEIARNDISAHFDKVERINRAFRNDKTIESQEQITTSEALQSISPLPMFLGDIDKLISISPCEGELLPGNETLISVTLNLPGLVDMFKTYRNSVALHALPTETSITIGTSESQDISEIQTASNTSSKRIIGSAKGKDQKREKSESRSQAILMDKIELDRVLSYYTLTFAKEEEDISMPPIKELAEFVRSVEETYAGFLLPCSVSERSEPNISALNPSTLFLKLEVPLVLPDIVILDPICTELSFGHCSVNQSIAKKLLICNVSSKAVETIIHLEGDSSFTLNSDKALLNPLEIREITVLFTPNVRGSASATIEITSNNTSLHIKVNGIAATPTVLTSVNNNVFCGDCLLGETLTQVITISNPCEFEVSVAASLAGNSHQGQPNMLNLNRTNAFTVEPVTAVIQPGGHQQLNISFKPDRESDLFHDIVLIQVEGEPTNIPIDVFGRCWDNTPFLQGYDDPNILQTHTTSYKFEEEWAQSMLADTMRAVNVDFSLLASTSFTEIDQDQAKQSHTTSAGSRDNKKKTSAPASVGTGVTDDAASDISKLFKFRLLRHVVASCNWCQNEATGRWFINPKSLALSYMKGGKVDAKKPCDFSFQGNDDLFNVWSVHHKAEEMHLDSPLVRFTPTCTKGSIEYGATERIAFELVDPIREFGRLVKKAEEYLLPVKGELEKPTTKHQLDKQRPTEAVFEEYDHPFPFLVTFSLKGMDREWVLLFQSNLCITSKP